MSFGFQLLNEMGDVVVDDTAPVFVVTQYETLSGATTTFSTTTYGPLFRYTIPPTNELVFFRLPNQNSMIYRAPTNLAGQNGWLANTASLQTFRCRRANLETTTPTGYGMVVRNAANEIIFRADRTTAAINEGILLKFDTTWHPSNYEWYCIPNAYAGIFSVSGSTLRYRGTGVTRVTTTHIRSFDTDHPDFPPFLVLTANSTI